MALQSNAADRLLSVLKYFLEIFSFRASYRIARQVKKVGRVVLRLDVLKRSDQQVVVVAIFDYCYLLYYI